MENAQSYYTVCVHDYFIHYYGTATLLEKPVCFCDNNFIMIYMLDNGLKN